MRGGSSGFDHSMSRSRGRGDSNRCPDGAPWRGCRDRADGLFLPVRATPARFHSGTRRRHRAVVGARGRLPPWMAQEVSALANNHIREERRVTVSSMASRAQAPIRTPQSKIFRTGAAERNVARRGSSGSSEFASFIMASRLRARWQLAKSLFPERA